MSEAEVLSIVAADGYRLACRRYVPSGGRRPRGLVVYLHGIQSHGGWYDASSRRLAEAGLAVYLPDRRGSGLNAADRGHAESWEQLAADVVAVEDRALADAGCITATKATASPGSAGGWYGHGGQTRGSAPTTTATANSSNGIDKQPGDHKGRPYDNKNSCDPLGNRPAGLPLMLVAVSWGGKLAAALAAMHGGRYAGLALLCPGICPQRDVSLGTKLRIAAALATGRRTERFAIPLDDPQLFTTTPRWLEFLARDPLALHEATAQFLFESRRLEATVAAMAPWIRVPTWLALAGRDRIIDNGRTLAWLCRLGSSERTVKLYEAAHHTLEFEPESEPIFADLAAWLADQAEKHNRM